ncbi:hypothetical protein ES708_18047 [subsurface metagenome]
MKQWREDNRERINLRYKTDLKFNLKKHYK